MERSLVEIIDDGVNPDWDGSVHLDIPPGKELDVITDRVGYEFMLLRREASDPEYQQHDNGTDREREEQTEEDVGQLAPFIGGHSAAGLASTSMLVMALPSGDMR